MTNDSISYLDKCLNHFTNNVSCYKFHISPAIACHSTISSMTNTILSKSGMVSSFDSSSSVTLNPFGVAAVGVIKTIIPCNYGKAGGQLYITTKALCFQRIGLFGLELERVIIPFHSVTNIEKSDAVMNGIFINTKDEKSYMFEFTINNVDKDMDLIQKSWRESPKTVHKAAVNEMFRSITTLTSGLGVSKQGHEDNDNGVLVDQENDAEDILNLSSVDSDQDQNDRRSKSSKLWNDYQTHIQEKSYKHIVAMNVNLDCSVKDFFETFLADSSQVSLAFCHEKNGSFDVSDSKWSFIEGGKMQRKIRYKSPVYVPMGPPHGQAEKTQTLAQFGHHGLCVITKTWVHGVPMADCFYIEDCLLVKADANGGVLVSIMFDISFVQRTLFKNVISMTAINDVNKFFKNYIDMIQKKVQQSGLENVDNKTHEMSSDLVMQDGNSDMLSKNEIVEETATKLRGLDTLLSIMKTFAQSFLVLSSNILEVKHLVWVLVIALLANQWYLISQLKFFQEKILLIESSIGS